MFNIKIVLLIGPLLGSPKGSLNSKILLYYVLEEKQAN